MKKYQDASEVKKCSARRDDRCGLSCACDLRSRCGLGTNGKSPGTGRIYLATRIAIESMGSLNLWTWENQDCFDKTRSRFARGDL